MRESNKAHLSPPAAGSPGADGLYASSGCSVGSDAVDGSYGGGYGAAYAAAVASVAMVYVA